MKGKFIVDKPDTLEKLNASSDRMRICFLDLETTGLDKNEDKIIEIAIKCIEITKQNGSDIALDAYESLKILALKFLKNL